MLSTDLTLEIEGSYTHATVYRYTSRPKHEILIRLSQRRRRWPSTATALARYLVFAVKPY